MMRKYKKRTLSWQICPGPLAARRRYCQDGHVRIIQKLGPCRWIVFSACQMIHPDLSSSAYRHLQRTRPSCALTGERLCLRVNESVKCDVRGGARRFLEARDVQRLRLGWDIFAVELRVSVVDVSLVEIGFPPRLSDGSMTCNQRAHVFNTLRKQTHNVNSLSPPPTVWLCYTRFFFHRNEHNSSTKCNYAKVSWPYIRIPRSATEQISRGINHRVFSRVG